jgi:protein phosphatase
MGTTLSALALVQDAAWTAHVGDSRIYRLREGFLDRLTRDHTWVEDVVSTGALTRDEAERHQYRHVLTRAIGTEEDLQADVDQHELSSGDTFLLCSDGLMNHVSDLRIHEVLESESPSPACWTLVGDALLGGGSDNTTVMVVRVDALEPRGGV